MGEKLSRLIDKYVSGAVQENIKLGLKNAVWTGLGSLLTLAAVYGPGIKEDLVNSWNQGVERREVLRKSSAPIRAEFGSNKDMYGIDVETGNMYKFKISFDGIPIKEFVCNNEDLIGHFFSLNPKLASYLKQKSLSEMDIIVPNGYVSGSELELALKKFALPESQKGQLDANSPKELLDKL